MKMLLIAVSLIAGCLNENGSGQSSETPSVSTGKVAYLCVGMETSARFGICTGCEKDANRLSTLMKDKFGYPGETLISEKATKATVVNKLKAGIEATPEDGLFLFFYSGHGGQEYLGGEEPDEADGLDEYLCLYDTYMLDDEIWKIVTSCRGRVFLYFDACHSATMYRSVASELKLTEEEKKGARRQAVALSADPNDLISSKGFTFRPERLVGGMPLALGSSNKIRLICWSGCKESEYSYGSRSGGMLTTAIVSAWEKGISYGVLWEAARSRVVREQPGQNPVQTHVGGGFTEEMEAFR